MFRGLCIIILSDEAANPNVRLPQAAVFSLARRAIAYLYRPNIAVQGWPIRCLGLGNQAQFEGQAIIEFEAG